MKVAWSSTKLVVTECIASAVQKSQIWNTMCAQRMYLGTPNLVLFLAVFSRYRTYQPTKVMFCFQPITIFQKRQLHNFIARLQRKLNIVTAPPRMPSNLPTKMDLQSMTANNPNPLQSAKEILKLVRPYRPFMRGAYNYS